MKKIKLKEEEINKIKKILSNFGLNKEDYNSSLNTYIESKTTYRKIKPGKVYTKKILSRIYQNNKKSIKKIGNQYIISEYMFNVIKKGANWYFNLLKYYQNNRYRNMTIEDIVF